MKTSKKSAVSLSKRARKIRLLLMDVDGVLTDGRVWLQSWPDGTAHEIKGFHAHDGAALKFAHHGGIRTGVITGRDSPAMKRRAKETWMDFVYQGRGEKLPAFEEILRKARLRAEEVCYIGDDLPDLPVMARAGLAVAVANSALEVKRAAHYVTRSRGGDGAVREVVELLLKAQGKWAKVIPRARA